MSKKLNVSESRKEIMLKLILRLPKIKKIKHSIFDIKTILENDDSIRGLENELENISFYYDLIEIKNKKIGNLIKTTYQLSKNQELLDDYLKKLS